MRNALLTACLLLSAAPAFAAEEPSGCDKFKWNIDHARAALTAPDRTKLNSGSELAALPATAVTIALVDGNNVINATEAHAGVPLSGTASGLAANSTFQVTVTNPSAPSLTCTSPTIEWNTASG